MSYGQLLPQAFVTGTLNWSDQGGGLHAMRNVKVEIWETYSVFADAMVASFNLDRQGQYNVNVGVPSLTRNGSYLKIFADNGASAASTDYVTTFVYQTGNAGALNNGINTINVNLATDQSGVFSVIDGMLTGQDFAKDVQGAAPGKAAVKFPSPDGTFYAAGTNRLDVVDADAFDWDPSVHEYGHYITITDGIGVSTPGKHSSGVSSIPALGKVTGARMGFKEGVATWFSIASQNWKQAGNNIPISAPRVGNLLYEDTVDATISYSAETLTGNKPQYTSNKGEGDELTTIRILWDLGDNSGPAEPKDRIARGQDQVYKDLKAAANAQGDGKLKNLSQVWNYYYDLQGAGNNAAKDKWRTDLGAIWEYNGVSPVPVATPAGLSVSETQDSLQFEWLVQNNSADETFQVIIWNSDFSTRLVTTADIVDYNGSLVYYTLGGADWTAIKNYFYASGAASLDFNFVVTGGDLRDDARNAYAGEAISARYWSDAYKFTLIPEPGAMTLLMLPAMTMVRRQRR
jgi:hypothetical protein